MGRILSRGNFSKDFEHFPSQTVNIAPTEITFANKKSSLFMQWSLITGPDFSISLDGGVKYWLIDTATKSFGGDVVRRSIFLKSTVNGTVIQGLVAVG